MSSQIAYAASFLRVVQESLSLGDQPVRRAVIDIQAGGAVKVYLERFVKDDELEKLGRLLLDLPRVDLGVEWVERISVGAGDGSEVAVHRLQEDDSSQREAMKSFLFFLKHASPQQQLAMRDLLDGGQ